MVIAGVILSVAKALMQRKLKSALTNVLISVYTFILSVLCCRARQHIVSQNNTIAEPKVLTIPYGTAIFAGVCAAGGIVLL